MKSKLLKKTVKIKTYWSEQSFRNLLITSKTIKLRAFAKVFFFTSSFERKKSRGKNRGKNLAEGGKIDNKTFRGVKLATKCLRGVKSSKKCLRGVKLVQNCPGRQKKKCPRGVKKSCFVTMGVRKIPVFSLEVDKNPKFVRGGHGDFPPPRPPLRFFYWNSPKNIRLKRNNLVLTRALQHFCS